MGGMAKSSTVEEPTPPAEPEPKPEPAEPKPEENDAARDEMARRAS